jgi:hypothetical protein
MKEVRVLGGLHRYPLFLSRHFPYSVRLPQKLPYAAVPAGDDRAPHIHFFCLSGLLEWGLNRSQ